MAPRSSCKSWVRYGPLPERSLRLLRLNTSPCDPSVGHLEVVGLDSAPPYYTLSHSWGTEPQTLHPPVIIDGESLRTGPAIANVLPLLQRLSKSGSGLDPPCAHIWIDRICVNQDDLQERASQVALMLEIFSRSTRTLIWLGAQTSFALHAAWSLVDRLAFLHESEKDEQGVASVSSGIYSDSSHAGFGLPPWGDDAWAEFRVLLGASWFSRIWVVQEVVHSTLDPFLVHGEGLLYPWHTLGLAAAWLRRKGYLRLSNMPEQLRNINTMSHLRRAAVKWPLGALLSITQVKFRATDQRDKVYALLGISSECSESIPDILKPDYTQDTAQLYRTVARFILQRGGATLAITTRARGTSGSLTRKQRQHDMQGMPSWTPDWSDFKVFNNGIRTSLAWVHYLGGELPHLGYPKHFLASAGLGVRVYEYENQDPAILRLGGIVCSRVAMAKKFPHNGSSNQEFGQMLAENLACMWHASAFQLQRVQDAEGWLRRLIQTTTADQHQLTERSREQGFRDGVAFFLDLLGSYDSESKSDGAGLRISFPERIFHGEDERLGLMQLLHRIADGGNAKHYIVLARNYCFNRSFILTGCGMMGLGPSDTRETDCVSVMLGGGVPYIIRRSGVYWVFVGEAYVEGLMKGEAVEACEQGTATWSILDII